jgi:hypothetical protein
MMEGCSAVKASSLSSELEEMTESVESTITISGVTMVLLPVVSSDASCLLFVFCISSSALGLPMFLFPFRDFNGVQTVFDL